MPFYNLSEFMELIKGDIGVKDIPLPVDDKEIVRHFELSALREFSVRYPLIREILLTQDDVVGRDMTSSSGSVTYVVPKKYWNGCTILDVLHILPGGYGSEADMYMPSVALGSADVILESIADIKMAASLGSMMTHAPTWKFDYPDRITIYNGWSAGSYRLEIALSHDLSLATIPPGAFTNLRQLATLDTKAYLYKKMKRLTNLETGIGSIDLKIDDWEGAESQMNDLLRDWDETVELGIHSINYW